MNIKFNFIFMILILISIIVLGNQKLFAHCDTIDGPLVIEVKKALKDSNIKPILKWVKKNDEKGIIELFEKVQSLKKDNEKSRELAEMYFIETLVRIHRAGEGAPYTGLKPEGTPIDIAVVKGDKALEDGKIEALADLLSNKVKEEIHKRFEKAYELKTKANIDVEIGREYIEAYVNYIHFVENIHEMIKSSEHGHSEELKKNDHKEKKEHKH